MAEQPFTEARWRLAGGGRAHRVRHRRRLPLRTGWDRSLCRRAEEYADRWEETDEGDFCLACEEEARKMVEYRELKEQDDA